jgi:hypothetical protein
MKKFITFTLCLLLCVVTLGLSGCGKSKKEIVDTSRASNGNGGMVVTQGDYVYFVNGYNSYSVLSKSNLTKKFDIGGLYRAKLNSYGELDYNEEGSLSNAERISSHLIGFESTSIYIFGDYIYYATPITDVDKKGNLQTDKLEFRRVAITGGDTDKLYQSKVEADKVKYEFYYADGKVYLLINEDGTLKRVVCSGKVSVNEVATDIASLALPRDSYDVFDTYSYKNIFYTKTNENGKIEIYNYNIVTNREEYKKTTDYKTCELIDYKFGHLYYKASSDQYPNYTYFYRVDATKNAITTLAEERLTANKDYTDLYFLENETDGFLVQTSDKTYYLNYNAGNISDPIVMADSKIEIMATKNSYVYYKSGNDIKRISYYDLKTKGSAEEESVLTLKDIQTYDYDIDDNNLYVYAKSGSNTYVYSIKVSNMMEEDEYEAKLLGVYKSGDVPTGEEE